MERRERIGWDVETIEKEAEFGVKKREKTN